MALPLPAICVVTRGRGAAGSPERQRLLDRLGAAVRAGATMIQVRERQMTDSELVRFTREVVERARPAGGLVVVNDRVDVALAAAADGVHLRSDSPDPADVRTIVPDRFLVGRSVHALGEARAVADAGACDYLLFGTVFQSESKPDGPEPAGIDQLAAVCAAVSLPVLAIGGISVDRAGDVRDAGAAGVAAISLFANASDISDVVVALRAALTLPERSV